MQATPETSPKRRLKLICSETEVYFFTFADREVMNKVKDMLQESIRKRNERETAKKEKEAEEEQAAHARRQEKEKKKEPKGGNLFLLDSKKLLHNYPLHQSLLKENKELTKTFQETVIEAGLQYDDFWSTRIHLLRAHALASSQKRGPYNVLSTIKPVTGSDNNAKVSLSREKISDIFEQYPIVRKAYDECVPKIDERKFWEQFFGSRLFRRLRGERQKPSDPTNVLLDKYIDQIETEGNNKRKADEMDENIPFFLDIEGNEENDPQKLGNRPDMTMRSGVEGPSSISLIRTMNNLAKKMVYGNNIVPRHDINEKNLEQELKLTGLEEEPVPAFQELHVKQDTSLSSANNDTEKSSPEVNHSDAVKYMKSEVTSILDLQQPGILHPESIRKAQKQVTKTINLRSKEASQNRSSEERISEEEVHAHVQLCHAASIEFLRHFWINFTYGDPANAAAVGRLVQQLKKCLLRIDAVEKSAPEDIRELSIAAMQPLVASIHKALAAYNKALSELLAKNQSQGQNDVSNRAQTEASAA